MKTLRKAVFLIVLLILSPESPSQHPATPQQREWLAKAERHERAGWIYVHIEGSPLARGFQHGFLLAREIGNALHSTQAAWRYYTSMEWNWLVQKSTSFFGGKIDAECLDELRGIVEGAKAAGVGTTTDELIAYNAYIELADYWWPQELKKMNEEAPRRARESCSSFIATGSYTADGEIVLGHNTMGGYVLSDENIVFDILPAKGHRILMQGTPGWIHSGTDFFLTDAGLVGSETTIGDFIGFDTSGVPEFVRMRRATQDASSIDEWIAIMRKGNNGGYANAWLLGDVRTNEIARFEIGLRYDNVERTKDGCYVGSNVAENLKILRLETTRPETDIRLSSVARRVRWNQLMREHRGAITVELAKAFEADHYDTFLHTERPGSRSLCGHWELDSLTIPSDVPFSPEGTVDAKVLDARLAREMAFVARWGSACGRSFDAAAFLAAHPQFEWMTTLLKSRPSQPWVTFRAGENKGK